MLKICLFTAPFCGMCKQIAKKVPKLAEDPAWEGADQSFTFIAQSFIIFFFKYIFPLFFYGVILNSILNLEFATQLSFLSGFGFAIFKIYTPLALFFYSFFVDFLKINVFTVYGILYTPFLKVHAFFVEILKMNGKKGGVSSWTVIIKFCWSEP